MIRWLYDLEDQFFYASVTQTGPAARRLQMWSQRFGRIGDLISARTTFRSERG
jgi:hypothetical protein